MHHHINGQYERAAPQQLPRHWGLFDRALGLRACIVQGFQLPCCGMQALTGVQRRQCTPPPP